ncbi:HAAO [Bugula neritina]|uniref:3-hydroxyanthranilate 3,4-dioxygenase n=1 Tax=Bugula neritina TaxID=10212 RepID=A0A7J7JN35_BUGNE|nr:HAAO [Bugula neritina]
MFEWIQKNSQFFLPPVCNKCMYATQMKCFFVGGPNVRKDYHIEEGPEFFYMVKGDMCLKVVEQNKHKDVIIKEGEVFMLPPRIPHSPQRKENTVGLVIERARDKTEKDCLRYFVEKEGSPTSEVLYEKWFHCEDLGPQLAAIVKEYFDTVQYKTGVPLPDSIPKPEDCPFKVDEERKLMTPFSLKQWLAENETKLCEQGAADLFDFMLPGGTEVKVYGKGEQHGVVKDAEILFWVLHGDCVVTDGGACKDYPISRDDTLWLPANTSYKLKVTEKDSKVLSIFMGSPA